MRLYITVSDFFFFLNFCLKNEEDRPKIYFFEFFEKLGHLFSLNLFYIESLYGLLCPHTNPMFWKNSIPDI